MSINWVNLKDEPSGRPNIEERLDRLENIAMEICGHILEHEQSWNRWADPFRDFVGKIKEERGIK